MPTPYKDTADVAYQIHIRFVPIQITAKRIVVRIHYIIW
jgi:hypothetical protein